MNKTLTLFLSLSFLFSFQFTQAQTAEEVIDAYFETIGGRENMSNLKSLKITGDGKAQGMDIPLTMYQVAPNKQRMDMDFQGQKITQMCFDGKTGWATNFMTMEAEAMDAEQSYILANSLDFPDAFLNYEKKGYKISLDGEETIEGADCIKVRLTRPELEIDGKKVENYSLYFFDKESFVPIMQREFGKTGETKGQAVDTYLSDFQEVAGVYYPHTITQKMNDMEIFSLSLKEVLVNPEIPADLFALPQAATSKED